MIMRDDTLLPTFKQHWQHHRYLQALIQAWQLPPLYNYRSVMPDDGGITLHDLVSRACQEAIARAWQSLPEQQIVAPWVENLLHTFPPSAALVEHNDGEAAESYRTRVLRAYLACVRAAVQGQWTSRNISFPELSRIAQETDLPVGFLHDLVLTLLPNHLGGGRIRQSPRPPVSTWALLVGQEHGVTALLTLELIEKEENSPSAVYPVVELAFVYRDEEFRDAEKKAGLVVESLLQSPGPCDVRWQLKRFDGHPIAALTGPSLGLAFAVGMTKLRASI